MKMAMVPLFLTLLVFECGPDFTPTSGPSGVTTSTTSSISALDLTGTWSGTHSDSLGSGTASWSISQVGNNVTGPATFTESGITARGSATGTLSGNTLTFAFSFPVGSIPPPFSGCAVTTNGTASGVTNTSISGTYTGNNTCQGPLANGRLTLAKQ